MNDLNFSKNNAILASPSNNQIKNSQCKMSKTNKINFSNSIGRNKEITANHFIFPTKEIFKKN